MRRSRGLGVLLWRCKDHTPFFCTLRTSVLFGADHDSLCSNVRMEVSKVKVMTWTELLEEASHFPGWSPKVLVAQRQGGGSSGSRPVLGRKVGLWKAGDLLN